MMTTLLDLCGKIDQPSRNLFETLNEIAAAIGTQFFVVGATARDMLLERGFGFSSRRATKDIDIGVRVSAWSEVQKLMECLLATGHFKKTKEPHRLLYRGELPVDILPFGEIANPDTKISWPPSHDVVMSVVGFEDAYQSAQRVRVQANPPLDIFVASLPGLAIMKILAWAEHPFERGKDAHDLAHILEKYLDAGNSERLQEEHDDLVSVENFDYLRAGARLMGRDIAKIGNPETKRKILEILGAETAEGSQYRLIRAMMAKSVLIDEKDNRFDENLAILGELLAGIREG
jgi:predicted nucleotidyltransferase